MQTQRDFFLSALLSLAALKKKNSKKNAKVNKEKDDEPSGNSQLRALEAHMLKLSKQGSQHYSPPCDEKDRYHFSWVSPKYLLPRQRKYTTVGVIFPFH